MKSSKWLKLFALLMALALVAAACGGDDDEEGPTAAEDEIGVLEVASGDPIKVAAIQAISGDVADLGTDQVRAIEIAIEQKGEILGHPIELQEEDGECAAEGGTTAAQKIASDQQVVGVVGTSCSGAAVPAAQIISEAGMVMISGSNTSPALTSLAGEKGSAWQPGYYRTAHNDEVQGEAAARFAFEELGVKKAASIHDGDPYTEGLAGVFNSSFEELGGEIVVATAVNKGDTNMRPVLTEIAAGGAELIFFPIFQPEGDFIARQATDIQGLEEATLMGADGLLSSTYVSIPATEEMYFSGPATPDTGAYNDFVVAYEDKFGEKPIQAFHGHAFDAANMLFAAIDKVAVENDDGSLSIPRQGLRDALYETEGLEGTTGTLTCDEFGDCADPAIDVVQNTEQEKSIDQVRGNVQFTFEPKEA